MSMNTTRRLFLQRTVALSAVGVVAGLVAPKSVLAAWPKSAFEAKKIDESLQHLMGISDTTDSADIKIKAPEIAENGAVVPVTVDSSIAGIESIAIMAENNPVPLVTSMTLGEGALGYMSSRIKMGKTGDVVAVVKANGKLFSARKQVKVTIGGCGG